MELTATFQLLGIALGLGLLVGLQRESVASRLAGVRTFPLITILGTVCALLAGSFGGWIIALGLLALAGLIFTGKMIEFKDREPDPGLTTEIAMLLMFGVGAYLVTGYKEVAIALGGGVAVLLHLKGQLHGLVARLGENDLKAIMQFTLISLVILPVLPDRTYGPYAVLNPRQVWWMVVLIVGISLGGYIVYKFFGAKAGIGLSGILGGVISSTATTVSYSRRASRVPDSSRLAAIIIMIASTVVFARLLLEVAVVQPSFLRAVGPPLLLMMLLLSMLSAWIWYRGRHEENEMPVQENPSELKSAIFFGLIYALALFAVAAAKERFGNQGLYLVAALSGLTDVDAITLSTSQLVGAGILNPEDGWRLVIMATLSNLIFKAATIALLAHRQLLMMIAPLYGVVLAAGLLLLLLWPVAG